MKIKSIEPLKNYDVLVVYEDNSRRIFHGAKLWQAKKKYAPLKDLDMFSKVYIYDCEHTIGWPGDLQISPEWLFEWSEPA